MTAASPRSHLSLRAFRGFARDFFLLVCSTVPTTVRAQRNTTEFTLSEHRCAPTQSAPSVQAVLFTAIRCPPAA